MLLRLTALLRRALCTRIAFALGWAGLFAPTLPAQTVRWEPPGGQLGFNQVSELALVFDNCEPDGEPRLPQVEGLTYGRPSQSSQTSIVNFKMSRVFSLSYPVRPSRRSPITIPAFEVQTDKGPLRVAAATFTVGDATVGSSGIALNEVATAKLTAPKPTVWAGEVFPVTYNISIVRRYFHSFGSNVEWSAAPLLTEDWSKLSPSEATLRGESFVVSTQTTRAYAKQPGALTLKPAAQLLNLLVGNVGFSIFAQPSVEQRQVDSNALELAVRPLPPPPPEFSGAVGEFTFVSKVVPVTAAVGEPVTWTLELAGIGNWPDIASLPPREVSNDFQVVQPKSKRTLKEGTVFEGTLTEDVVLVPSRADTYRLPSVRFTYFDPKSGSYRTIATEPVTINVTAVSAPVRPPAGSGAPVQFSLNPPPASGTAALPAPVPPLPPENLPRDPLGGSGRSLVPLAMHPLVLVCLAVTVLLPLGAWLFLAALRSRANDPQRPRREAKRALAAVLAQLRGADAPADALRRWQQHTAALWEVPHAAPGAPLLHACVTPRSRDAAPAWARLWAEADRTLHGRAAALPSDWVLRAEGALQAVSIPGWSPLSLFAPSHLLPFLVRPGAPRAGGLGRAVRAAAWFVVLAGFTLPAPPGLGAEAEAPEYARGDFAAAEKNWRAALAATPSDWIARHNLGLALAQQDRWAEATGHWTAAFLLRARNDATRWDLALGLQRSGLAPPELVELSRGEGRFQVARLATPAEWQALLVAASLLLVLALGLLLLLGYRRAGSWALPAALGASLVAVALAAVATFSLRVYGPLADPRAAVVWKATVLRSIPTEADSTQKTSPLSAGSIALAERTFLGWTKLTFPAGQSGWVRSEDLITFYR
ncbi:MAG: BatD family protein [Opitutaceae bacterium]|nr:BatD family protein [Opitutaceae bacterium]